MAGKTRSARAPPRGTLTDGEPEEAVKPPTSREVAVGLLAEALGRAAGEIELEPAPTPEELAATAVALEAAAHAHWAREQAQRDGPRRTFVTAIRELAAALGRPAGPYPDDVPVRMALAGRPADAVAGALAASDDPRQIVVRLLVRLLLEASDVLAADRPRALALAEALEVSCYKAVIQLCKRLDNAPQRRWNSPEFVNIYSSRCGVVASLLDPDGDSCRAYGPVLVGRLLGDPPLDPAAVGEMSEKELCPQATAAERAEIARRSEQKVVEKTTNLFRCPHCHERRSTYREVQDRGPDEAPSYYCLCQNPSCRRRFKGHS